MKDHEKRGLVDNMTRIARQYAGTQQLRARIAAELLPALELALDNERERCARRVSRVANKMNDEMREGSRSAWPDQVGFACASSIRRTKSHADQA